METYRNQKLQNKSIVFDESAFIECKLIDCDLYYSGGDFEFVNTTFENCRFHWRGAAKNTLALTQLLQMSSQGTAPSTAQATPPATKPN